MSGGVGGFIYTALFYIKWLHSIREAITMVLSL